MIWLALTLCSLLALLAAEHSGAQPWIRRCKPLASAGFLGWAVHHGALHSAYGQAILAGLVLSWFGDVFLLSKRSGWFLAGLGFFLAAHLAYLVAFVGRGVAGGAVGLALLGLLPLAWRIRRWLRPNLPADMRRPVDGYILVISVMVATAFGAWHRGAPDTLLLGAVAFFLSDLSVARDRFVDGAFVNRAWGLPMYYVAQLLLGSTC